MSRKTHTTAVVLIPPEEVWPPIQAIRERHDRQARRWMPHVTLLYPFRPPDLFPEALPHLEAAAGAIAPFEVELRGFGAFRHPGGSHTLWLRPEPGEALRRLRAALLAPLPDLDDTARHEGGFTPHLSVGQARGAAALERLREELARTFPGVRFTARVVAVIRRGPDTGDVFQVAERIRLGPG